MIAPRFDAPPDSTVFIVDDDEAVRESLARLCRSVRLRADAFGSAEAFLASPDPAGPSCVVLDIQMPGTDGLAVQQQIARRQAQIVFLTGHGDVPMCAEAMKAGAVDFLTKPADETDLLEAIDRALVRSAEVLKTRSNRVAARALLEALTPREFEVMQRVIAGMLNKQIAEDLGAAEKTVKIHRGRMMEKMGVTSVADLVRVAQTAGVMPVKAGAGP